MSDRNDISSTGKISLVDLQERIDEIAFDAEKALAVKPGYICELEKELLTLTPDEANKAAGFVFSLKSERPKTYLNV